MPNPLDRKVIVTIDGEHYDLSLFASRHAGGSDVIEHLHGKDISVLLRQVHNDDAEVWRLLKSCRIYSGRKPRRCPVTGSTLTQDEKDWFALFKKFKELGLFEAKVSDLTISFALPILGFWMLGIAASFFSFPLALLFLTLSASKSVHLLHDLGHHAIMRTGEQNRSLTRWLGIILLGMDTRVFCSNHMIHHSFTNVLEQDEALDNHPVVWHPDQGNPYSGQEKYWYAMLSVAGIYFWIGQFVRIVPKPLAKFFPYQNWLKGNHRQSQVLMDFNDSALTLLRFAISFYFLGFWLTLAPAVIAVGITAFFASLNHFHLPIFREEELKNDAFTHISHQTHTTQSWYWRPRWLWSWLSGGLDSHLTHHLFPTMPSYNFAKANPYVREFCESHNLPYHECTFPKAVAKAHRKSTHPFEPVKSSTEHAS